MNRPKRCPAHLFMVILLFQLLSLKAIGQDRGWLLNIEMPGARTAEQAPVINPNERPPLQPTMDPQTGRWFVPITRNTQEFVNSYVVEARDKKVIAVQVGVPLRLIRENQYVYLAPSTVQTVDESLVSQLWSSNRIMSEPSEAKTQFGYLQDLVYINKAIMEEQQRRGNGRTINAMSLRAAFMLLQVVRNLAQNTWYVVDDATTQVIEHARRQIDLGNSEDRYCRWLGRAVCTSKGAQDLDRTVKTLESARFTRMYIMLVPEKAKLDQSFCSEAKIQNMKDFLLYFTRKQSGGSKAVGLSESRLLNDLAACQVAHALCTPKDSAQIIEELGAAKEMLEEALMPETQMRLREVSGALDDINSGKPAVCPFRG